VNETDDQYLFEFLERSAREAHREMHPLTEKAADAPH